MYWLNTVLRGLFDALLFPFQGLSPLVGLLVVSVLTAIGMLLVFKATSDQAALEGVKRQIHAGLFEIRLFNDDFRAILGAQRDILRHNLSYLRLSLVPMLFLLPPLVLVVAQLQFHYGYAPPEPGEALLVEARLAEEWEAALPASPAGKPQLALEAPQGLRVETPPVWVPGDRTLSWRVRVLAEGDYELTVAAGQERFVKTLRTAEGPGRRSPVRPERSFLDQLVYPAEPPLPAGSAVEAIDVALPPAVLDVLGWEMGPMAGIPAWMVLYFVLAIVFAFALRKPLGVQI